jgi:hypothetical protein
MRVLDPELEKRVAVEMMGGSSGKVRLAARLT